MITFSSDDGGIGVYDNRDIFIERDIPLTCFIITDYVASGYANTMNVSNMLELQTAGWEIGSHSKSHADLRAVNETTLLTETLGSKQILESWGLDVNSFAYPYGYSSNTVTMTALEHYSAVRDIANEDTYYVANDEQRTLASSHYFGISIKNDLAFNKNYIDEAIENGDWLHLMFHNITVDGKLSPTWSYYLYELLDYVESKADLGLINPVNFYEGHRLLLDREQDISTKGMIVSGQPSCVDLSEDMIIDQRIRVEGITLNNSLTNPSFETYSGGTFTGWQFGGGLLTKTQSSDEYIGTYAADLKYNLGTASYLWTLYQDVMLADHNISVGDNVFGMIYLKNVTNVTKFTVMVEFYPAGAGSRISWFGYTGFTASTSYAMTPTGVSGVWAQVPEGAGKIRFKVEINAVVVGATDATFRADGAVFCKLPFDPMPVSSLDPPYYRTPIAPWVGANDTTNPSVIVDGVTYSYAGTLGENEYVEFDPSADLTGFVEINSTIGGHGLAYVSIEGNRSASVNYGKIAPSATPGYVRVYDYSTKTSVKFWEPINNKVYLDAPVSLTCSINIEENGTFYAINDDGTTGPYDSINGWITALLPPGESTIVTEQVHRDILMDEAISPIFAIIPIVILVGLIPMVMGLGKKLK